MVRFQADADLNQTIVAALLRRAPGVDFRTAELAQIRGIGDPDVLAIVAYEERILVTHDSKTMPRHFRFFESRSDLERSARVVLVLAFKREEAASGRHTAGKGGASPT